MFGIWAIARQTFAQCLRMKVAGVFILLLAVCLAAMPSIMTGDGTLAGQVRTFLAYSTGMTSLLLSLVTVFLATSVVSSDIRDRTIFTVATKPLARWQYVLGRWLGVVLLDAALLAIACIAIYALAQHLRSGPAQNTNDRRAVETEVFASREQAIAKPYELDKEVEKQINKLRDRGAFDSIMEDYKLKAGGSVDKAEEMMLADIRRQCAEDLQSIGPGKTATWKFSGVKSVGADVKVTGKVVAVNRIQRRLGDKTVPVLAMWIEGPQRELSRLIAPGPVQVNSVYGRVEELGAKGFLVHFFDPQMSQATVKDLGPGNSVEVLIEPTIQISFMATPGKDNVSSLYGVWKAMNNATGFMYQEDRDDPVRMQATWTVPLRVADDQGNLTVEYTSRAPGSVMVLTQDVRVLYPADTFEWNFLRGSILMLLQLVFLAALGVLAGTFLSFPVAVMVCFMVLMVTLPRDYLSESVKMSSAAAGGKDMLLEAGKYVMTALNTILPDLRSTSPTDNFVDGMNISWARLGWTMLVQILVRTALVLGVACYIFRKRELARVQV